MSGLAIRPYEPGDYDAMLNVFTVTAHEDLHKGGDDILSLASYVWCRPYLMLEPQNCFVLVKTENNLAERDDAVGYIIGTANTREFVQKWHEKFISFVQSIQISPPSQPHFTDLTNVLRHHIYNPDLLLHHTRSSLVDAFPAHLHIDILPSYQRRGYGRELISVFTNHVRAQGATGVHLTKSNTNFGAESFYRRMQFAIYLEEKPQPSGDVCMTLKL